MHPLDRCLLVLSLTLSFPSENLARWPLGRRNRALFELHCGSFGPRLQGWTACGVCEEKIEFDLDANVLMTVQEEGQGFEGELTVHDDRFRLPTSRDVADIAAADDTKPAAIRLLERCRVGGSESFQWTETMLEEIEESMASADPMAETQLALVCPECGFAWDESLDIGRFVWAEIEARARRLLWEVHMLALAYGWTEAETLSVSAVRRAAYLEMVQA